MADMLLHSLSLFYILCRPSYSRADSKTIVQKFMKAFTFFTHHIYAFQFFLDVEPPGVCFWMTLRGIQSLSLGQCILLQV